MAISPYVSRFVGRLFKVEKEIAELATEVGERDPLWAFKSDFAKKRVLKDSAGKAWKGTFAEAGCGRDGGDHRHVSAASGCRSARDAELPRRGIGGRTRGADARRRRRHRAQSGEGRRRAVDRRASRSLLDRARRAREELWRIADQRRSVQRSRIRPRSRTPSSTRSSRSRSTRSRRGSRIGARTTTIRRPSGRRSTSPKTVDHQHLVELRRPEPKLPELFVGPDHERRERDGFPLTDRRGDPRVVEQEIDYCLYCHERDKDSCSKGLRDNKTNEIKKNPLGVPLDGCPLDEKISEMHVRRRLGDALGALAIVIIDNPMCPGTGHRICNDCMKACVFQKQEPVNIPQIETRVLTEVLSLALRPRDLRPPDALEPARRSPSRMPCRTTARTSSSSASAPPGTRSSTTSRGKASASRRSTGSRSSRCRSS